MEVPVAEITIGDRCRKEMGDLQGLALSINAVGLLHPIGITPNKQLVFGERRLKAVRDILKEPTIEARVIDIQHVALGEYHENEIRKDFTVTERVAIGKAVEEAIKKKRPKDSLVPGKCPEQETLQGHETREVAAEAAGFTSERQYRRAKQVDESGADEVKEAMDAKEVSVSDAAAAVAELPKAEQRKAVKAVKAGKAKTLKAAAKPKKAGTWFDTARQLVGKLVRLCEANKGGGNNRYWDGVYTHLNGLKKTLTAWESA